MKIFLLTIYFVLFGNWVSAAEIPYLPEEYTILCVPEESTGLNWAHDKWDPALLQKANKLITKIPDAQCRRGGRIDFVKGEKWAVKPACLNLRKVGGNPGSRHVPQAWCVEEYAKVNGLWETSIHCKDLWPHEAIYLSPGGWYHYSYYHGDLRKHPYDGLKRNLVLEVGKCSMTRY